MTHYIRTALLCTLVLSLLVGPASAEDFPPLRESKDQALQSGLERVVRQRGLWREATAGHLALALVDISNKTRPRLAELNGDRMMYAASLPKLAILLGAFVQLEQGKLAPDRVLLSDMNDMIRFSDNADANRVLAQVGRGELLDILQSPRFRLYDPAHGGGLWVGKDYARTNAFRRDPIHNLSHGASAIQVARFFYLLATDRLVSSQWSRQMKQILSEPGVEHKFVRGLKERPGAKLYRKSGTWRQFHSDSALVEYGDCHYIVVGLTADPRGGHWLTALAAPLHDLVCAR